MRKIRFFDSGVYRETMRSLRTWGILMLIFVILPNVPYWIEAMMGNTDSVIESFTYAYPLQYVLPFFAPFWLTLSVFGFQTRRCDSDFYHALPYSRTTLAGSMLGAVATWCAIILLGGTAVSALSCLPFECEFTFADVVLSAFGSLTASLLTLSLTFLVVSMCGNWTSSIFGVLTLMFAPLLIVSSLTDSLVYSVPILTHSDTLTNLTRYCLLYGGYDTLKAWIGTILGIAVFFTLGFVMNKHRPSETAGNASTHPILQAALRLLVSLTCCLPAIDMIAADGLMYDSDRVTIITLYVLALLAYFLYELFTTKKPKNLLKAIPWVGALALLNIVCIFGLQFAQQWALSIRPTADDTEWVSVVRIDNATPLYEHELADLGVYYAEESALATSLPVYPTTYFDTYDYHDDYRQNGCDDVRLTDERSKTILCERLAEACKSFERDGYQTWAEKSKGFVNKEWQMYDVEIAIHANGVTYHRAIWLYDSELAHLLSMINEQARVPHLYHEDGSFPNF